MNMFERFINKILAWMGLDYGIEFQMYADFFNQVGDGLYVGSRPTPKLVDSLKEEGMTHVVSCLDEAERDQMAFLAGDFDTLFLPVHDGINENISAEFAPFFNFVTKAQNNNPNAKILVHCQAGVSRSSTLAIAWLMQQHQTRFLETYLDVRSKRIQVLPNIGFASQLQRLEFESHPQKRADGDYSSLAQYLHQICNTPVDIELLETMLEQHDYDAFTAICAIFGDDFPRVIQGVRF